MKKSKMDRCILSVAAIVLVSVGETYSETRTIRVIDDASDPVLSEISKIGTDGHKSRLGKTDVNGVLQTEIICSQGERVLVKPSDVNYYIDDQTECPIKDDVTIKVTRKNILMNLRSAASKAEREGDHGKASLLYQEIAARARGFDKDLALNAEKKVYETLGKELRVASPVVSVSGGADVVMSSDLRFAVKQFQKHNGIKPTGELNYTTLEKVSGKQIGVYLKK